MGCVAILSDCNLFTILYSVPNFIVDISTGGAGSSGSECNTVYRGPSPGSEPETVAVLNYTTQIFPPNQRGDDPADSDPAPDDATGVAIDVHS